MRLEEEEQLSLFSAVLTGLLVNPKTSIPHPDNEPGKYDTLVKQAWTIAKRARTHFEAETSR